MTKQKVVITTDEIEINELINAGWCVKSVTAQHVAPGVNYSHSEVKGSFCFLLEKYA